MELFFLNGSLLPVRSLAFVDIKADRMEASISYFGCRRYHYYSSIVTCIVHRMSYELTYMTLCIAYFGQNSRTTYFSLGKACAEESALLNSEILESQRIDVIIIIMINNCNTKNHCYKTVFKKQIIIIIAVMGAAWS